MRCTFFFLLLIIKYELIEERTILKKEPIVETFSDYPDCKKKKKLNFRNSLLGKYVLDRRPNGQELASAEENRCVIHGSPQPSQQQIGREVESRRKDLWRTPFPNEVNPHDIHWEATTFFKEFISAKNCQRALKVKETGENKKRLSESQTSRSRKQVDKTSQLPGM